MCWYVCIGFVGIILKGKILLQYTNLFSIDSKKVKMVNIKSRKYRTSAKCRKFKNSNIS